ncbi:MAG: TonB-dependent receptor [Prevotellaceae bacterium]|nr:TonB-dependent receptor [Prevotellaceae bacterium]
MSGLLLFIMMLFCVGSTAQTFRGHVYTEENGKKVPLTSAAVYFSGASYGVETDNRGAFRIERKSDKDKYLVASMIGFVTDSLLITGITDNLTFTLVEGGEELDAVTVSSARDGVVLSRLTSAKTELITSTGLKKMACCNLSESFENSATVTVGFTDAISGAKQVQLLGLSGLYSQLLTENIPTLRGQLSTFGWSYIPGSWMESIQISKGASSVVNGYESLSGQINLEMKKPNYTEPLFINLFADHLGRYEANITSATQVAKDLWAGLLLHGSAETGAHDYNNDTFMDMPQSKFVNLYNRWFYLSENGIQSRTGIRFLYDSRNAGQDEHLHSITDNGDHGELYKTTIRNKGFAVENKTGFSVGEKEGQSVGIISSFNYSGENLVYGRKTYNGEQNSFYSNVLFTSDFGEAHRYTIGASFAYDSYKTLFEDSLFYSKTPRTAIDRYEAISGAFAEYTYSLKDKFTFVVGVREDYNSRFGWLFTPRANIRYNIINELVFRVSAGQGYRSPNVIADNIGLLATSRKFDVDAIEVLDIEQAWNYGGNLSAYIPVGEEKTLTLSLDYFHTQFGNQAVIDVERDRNKVFFYNLQGVSYADTWQIDASVSPFKGFDIFAAFRYNDTKITYSDNGVEYTKERPLTSRYRGLVNLSYATSLRKWVFDVTAQFNGPSRILGLNGYDSETRHSEMFPIYFAQITKNSKRFDIYIGAENILDFKQKNPILNAELPFGQDFDSSLVWGPIVGRKLYAGIRWRIGKLP